MSTDDVPDETMLNITPEAIEAFERGERLFAYDDHGRRFEIKPGPNAVSRAELARSLREMGIFTFHAGNELN